MDFSLTAEQTLIKASVDRFVAGAYGAEQRAAIARSEDGFSRAHWATFAELGWLGLLVDEERGGFGGGAVETMIVMEAFGAGLVAEPFVPAVVVAGTLLAAAAGLARSPAETRACAALLAEAVAGERMLSVAYAEPAGGYDPAWVTTRAARDGTDFVVDGNKIAVPYGAAADTLLVSVRTSAPAAENTATAGNAGISLLAIDARAPGIERRDYVTYDERRASDITFERVRVPSDALVGPLGGGLPLLEDALARGNAALCAEAVGAMGVVHRSTVEFLQTRVQFGRPIGTFQALQHRAVDMLVALELARAIATYAAAAIDGDDPAAGRAASAAAKVQIAESSRFVGESAIQLHGAIGITEELALGHYVKRLVTLEREFGDAAYSLGRYMQAAQTSCAPKR